VKLIIFFAQFLLYLLLDDSAGRIARERWWMNLEFSFVDSVVIIWLSILIDHLGDEQ
jgi:hypothetical protein